MGSTGEQQGAYVMAAATDEQFERAIADAREEGNLSRARVRNHGNEHLTALELLGAG